jgi:adenylate cyclase
MPPHDVIAMLNEHMTALTRIVHEHHGIVDKFVGDALMAIFGAPVENAADADNALRVACDMIRALERLNARRAEAGQEAIDIGVGLATGEVLAGSVGSIKRMEYTVIGDTVNLAARLESANKHYGTKVLVSGPTVEALRSPGVLRRLDLLQVKGKSRPTVVYESLSHHTAQSFPQLPDVIRLYEAGFDRYQLRDWDGAIARFAETLELAPQDRPARIFLDRCRFYRLNPPAEDWNGVWIMDEK